MTTFLIITAVIIGILLIISTAASVFFFRYAIPHRAYVSCISGDADRDRKRLGRFYGIMKTGHDRTTAYKFEKCVITSYDGLKLTGWYLPAEKPGKNYIILVHGWTGSYYDDFCLVSEWYRTHGCNILAVEQRAQGSSEGKYMCFGCKEKHDVADWCVYLNEKFGSGINIVLHGISMGSATVMYAAGEKLPSDVKGVVADCGYTSPYREFCDVLKHSYKLPPFPVINITGLIARLTAGFGFRDDDSIKVMKRMTLPILFIHTKTDGFVSVKNTYENYEACVSDKQIYLVEDAPHGMAFAADYEGCTNALSEFINKITA